MTTKTQMVRPKDSRAWLTANVWFIALSAFFADLGYQVVLAGFPLFLVLHLHAPIWTYGMAMAVAYGPGALIAWWGGRVGDRRGHKRVALWGNAFIPVLAFAGWATTALGAIGLFSFGWWARNFRSPSRRTMLREVVAESDRAKAFGFLHSLDVAGGMLAGLLLLALVAYQVSFRTIFTLALVPLGISTIMLGRVQAGRRPVPQPSTARATSPKANPGNGAPTLYRGLLLSAALYGFSTYSIGFPILTVAQGTHHTSFGILAYILFLAVSAITGLLFGRRARATLPELAGWGYFGAALGSAGLALAYGFHLGLLGFAVPIALLGFALGVIETLEPTLVARFVPNVSAGQGLGGLTGARSLGLFVANGLMGLLYHFTPVYAYSYATGMALLAMVVVLLVHIRSLRITTL